MKINFHFSLEPPREYRLYLFIYFCTEVQIMIYNIVLGLGVQHSDWAFFKRLYFIESYYKVMTVILCAIQYILVACPFYAWYFVSVKPIPLSCPCRLPSPLVFYIYQSVSILHIHSFVLFFRLQYKRGIIQYLPPNIHFRLTYKLSSAKIVNTKST